MQTKEELKLMQENARLKGEVVFLAKQVSNRDKTIQAFEELSHLETEMVYYEDYV